MQTHMRRLARLALLTAALLAPLPPLRAAAAPAPADPLIRASDLLKLRQLDAPALSPDGQQVIYTVKSMVELPDKKGEYRYQTQLWLAATDGRSAPRELTHGTADASAPQWSPDGRRVAFLRKDKAKPQLWILPLADGGEAFALTQLESGAAQPQWSPDGQRLAFTSSLSLTEVRRERAKLPGPPPPPDWAEERPQRSPGDTADWFDKAKDVKRPTASPDGTRQEQREWLAQNEADGNPRVLHRLNFLGESDLEPQPTFASLYVVEAREGAAPRALTPGYRSVGRAAWSPDGRQLVFAIDAANGRHPDRELAHSLELVQADGTGRAALLVDAGESFSEPRFSPDGRLVAFLAQQVAVNPVYAQVRVGCLRLGGAAAPWYADALDRSASAPRWSADSRHIYFTAASNGGFPLYRVAAQPLAPPERLTGFDQGVAAFDLGRDRLAYVLTLAANPSELYTAAPDATAPRRLTTHNQEWLSDKHVSLPEHRTLTRPNGLVVDVWLIKPATCVAGKKYPLLLEIHGGPQAMWGPGEASMWHEFQFFAARGYGVVYANPRGSGGYGYAFQHANYQDWGPGPGGDVLAAADLAAREPWADASRQVVTGGSYGGYLTAWVVTQDHRFKAAIAVRGVYDLVTFFGEGNAWRLVPYDFGGYPWQKDVRARLEANSPLTFVDQITTPLLIKHGDADLRTGVIQSEMLYRSLKVLGRPVEYARYPRGTHELSRSGEPRQRLDRIVRFDEFFRRYLGEE